MAIISSTRGMALGTLGDDFFDIVAQVGLGQIHSYDPGGNDTLDLGFNGINSYSHGHHARAGGGHDVFNFVDLDQVTGLVVGRIEDFDPTRDEIQINGETLDLSNLPENVRLVGYAGDLNDVGANEQTWLLIDTGTGHIFYALEGARVDMTGDGDSNSGNQEFHFASLAGIPDFALLPDRTIIDQNFVPIGFAPEDGGLILNDTDGDMSDVLEQVRGSFAGDVIAAGLNNDIVVGFAGDDSIWGGSGHDLIRGQNGNDILLGGSGDDTLVGGDGSDRLDGAGGQNFLNGNGGNDTLIGGSDDDRINGGQNDDYMVGADGDDILNGGSGNDTLIGGGQDDVLRGSGGSDVFVFAGSFGTDRIADFDVAKAGEVIDLSAVDSITDFADLAADHLSQVGVNTVIDAGDGNVITLINVDATTLTADDFVF